MAWPIVGLGTAAPYGKQLTVALSMSSKMRVFGATSSGLKVSLRRVTGGTWHGAAAPTF